MRMRQALRDTSAQLAAAGIDSPALEARLLAAHALGATQEELLAADSLPPEAEKRLQALLARRAVREPLAYITGEREFYGLPFRVAPGVLIPRPDTETVVEAVLERVRSAECRVPSSNAFLSTRHSAPITILDLGTGSGCILLSLLSALAAAEGTGVDTSEAAVSLAGRNAAALQLADRARFLESDWCAWLAGKKFEIVVANPPYIASNDFRSLMPEVAMWEPRSALDGGEDGLRCYREIASQLSAYLQTNAMVAMEVGEGQDQKVAAIFSGAGYCVEAVKKDLSGMPRCVVSRWTG